MKTWYVHRGGRAVGPVTREQVAGAIAAGKVHAEDLFCEVNHHDWVRGDEVPDLRDLWEELESTGEIVLADSDVIPLDFDDLQSASDSQLPPPPRVGDVAQFDAAPTDLFSRDTLPPGIVLPAAEPAQTTQTTQTTQPAQPVPVAAPPEPVASEPPPKFSAPPVAIEEPTEVFQRRPASSGDRRVGLIAALLLGAAAVSFVVFLVLVDNEPIEQASAPAEPTPTGSLPAPFNAVHIGISREDLLALFPPREPTSDCRFPVVGQRPALPQSDHPNAAHARCIYSDAVAGITRSERARIQRHAHELASEGELREEDAADGLVLALAQVRGTVRAGYIPERALVQALGTTGTPMREASFGLSMVLADGSLGFLTSRSQRRSVAAMLDESCQDVDPTLLNAFVRGQQNPRASRRCGSQLARQRGHLTGRLLRGSGGVIGVGLLRSLRDDVDPDEPASYRELLSLAGLEDEQASFAVRVANHLDDVEDYFQGAIVLVPEHDEDGHAPIWGSAIVWFEDDHATRLTLNIADDDALESLQAFLPASFGRPDQDEPNYASWNGDGWTARLDRGASLALTLQAD